MSDLVEHLGIARASIYGTFGNKRELYLKALDRYGETKDPELLDELSQPGPALPRVRAVVRRFVEEATGVDGARGCFMTNTAVELCPHDQLARRRVEASCDHLQTLLTSALVRAQAQGELPEDRDPRALARLLLVLMQGIRVLGKVAPDRSRLQDAATQALSLLE